MTVATAAGAVRYAFDDDLRRRVAQRLAAFAVREIDAGERRRAAVAFTLVACTRPAGIHRIAHREADREQAGFILTTRAAGLSSHGGQRAFPGGRIDAGETALDAALRELAEEVGLALDPGRLLGRLDDYATRSGYVISPLVFWGDGDAELRPNPDEVAAIHRVPLRELARADAPLLEPVDGGDAPALKMPLGDGWFAAPSAAIAFQFREVALFGRATRVAHFEQPRFAWK